MADIRAELRSKTKVRASIRQATGAAGAKQHSQLSGRDVPDQHPMSAITGLVSALAKKSDGLEITSEGLVYLTSDGERVAGPYELFSPGDGEHSGPAYVASDEPPEDTDALWVNTSEPEEAIALGVTVEETETGVDIYGTDELGTTKASLRHGRDGEPGSFNLTGATPGQFVRIATVDDKGVPTAWEPVSTPGREIELLDTSIEILAEEPVKVLEWDLPEEAKRCDTFYIEAYASKPTNAAANALNVRLTICGQELAGSSNGNGAFRKDGQTWVTVMADLPKRTVINAMYANSPEYNVSYSMSTWRSGIMLSVEERSNIFKMRLLSEYAGTISVRIWGFCGWEVVSNA